MQKKSKHYFYNQWRGDDGRSERPSSRSKLGLGILVITTVFVGLRLLPGCNKQTIDPPPANILVIALCSVRPDHMSAYGYQRDTTPFMKSLAGESVVFDQAVTQWPKTVPAFSALMTGKYGHSNGVMRFTVGQILSDNHKTLAEVLGDAGYESAAFISSAALHDQTNIFQGFDYYQATYQRPNRYDDATTEALAWLSKSGRKPFLLWVHYNNAHYPYRGGGAPPDMFVDDQYYDASRRVKLNSNDPMPLPVSHHRTPEAIEEVVRANIGGIHPWAKLNGRPQELDFYIARYDAGIFAADNQVKRLISVARKKGLLGNTIIAVVGDHGEALGEHNYYFEHGRFPYDDCMLVPMLIRPVNDIKPVRIKTPVPVFALAPTLLEMVGLTHPQAMEAPSLWGLMRGEKSPRYIFTESGYQPNYTLSVRDERWKLIHIPNPIDQYLMKGTPYELYDLTRDPGEIINLYQPHHDIAARLKTTLDAWSSPWIAQTYSGPMKKNIELGAPTIERLRTLGYVQ